jgi:NADPH-dependent glutamate synthase beta subunit-like oxidoreductase
MMMYGIPSYKLEKDVLLAEVEIIKIWASRFAAASRLAAT